MAYVRVSTQDQVDGVSLDAQEARIAAYCVAMAWSVSEVVRDAGESAKSLQRPGMAKLLADVRGGSVERVVVFKLDRFTRSTRDLADLLDLFTKAGTALVSVSESLDTASASGRLVVNMLGVVAQWEREAIGERTASALGYKRQQRRVYGHVPFGWQRDGDRLVAVEAEQEALEEMRRMACHGSTLREMGEMLVVRGAASPERSALARCERAGHPTFKDGNGARIGSMTFKCACDLIRREYGTAANFMTPEVLEMGWIVPGKIAYELSTGDFLHETLYAVSVVMADSTTEKGTRRAGTTDGISAVFKNRESAQAHIERLRQDGCGCRGGAPINGGERAGKDDAQASPVSKIDWASYTKWYVERVLPLKQQDRAGRALLWARLESCLESRLHEQEEEDKG